MTTRADPSLARLMAGARDAGTDIAACLALCRELGSALPPPGRGGTARRWAALTALGRGGLTAARVVEAHADALAILAEAADAPGAPDTAGFEGSTWGVFAAEVPGATLTASPADGPGVRLDGDKPWCSLGDVLDRALVTAHGPQGRQLFAVDLRHPSVTSQPAGQWVARGLPTVVSVPLHFAGTPAQPVGGPEWYLTRPGFAWGGIGVAACWYGGALGVRDTVHRAPAARRGDLAALHVGSVDVALEAASAVLERAAALVDAGGVEDPELLALRVRSVVWQAVETTLTHAAHALGPGPLAFDDEYAGRVADLDLYVRQHHAERDLAALGARVLDADR